MSDVDYSFGNADHPGGGDAGRDDQREDYRLSGSASVALELESEPPEENGEASAEARTLTCRIRDLSARGLCLVVPQALTVGALLPSRVTLGEGREAYALTVEVVWCRPDEDGRWLVGAEIQDSDDTSYVDWVEAVARAMTED